ncbi:MFS transporter [Aspergillus affinis]|uniref:MFS transporter n=1 Tax=Aspergillus affinis TaxID=1070780 RepID=UPI0022FE1EF8|nr:permease of the major facilitator superfamily [Aspergillus affinis]KAI9035833.1 permease of the major facilitator superfamily [Aspergillus affinis]
MNEPKETDSQHLENVQGHDGGKGAEFVFVPANEQSLIRRKFDRRVLPLVCILYILSYLDRGNIGNAKTAGLDTDLGLDDQQWAWILYSFYICYILFEWTTVLWKIFPAHIYISILCICWGAAAMCSGAVNNMAELIVCRCLLGVFEAAFGAGAPYFLSLFYQRQELGFRVSILLGMSPVANCFASALAYGITQIRHSISSWRYLFIIEGAPTVLFSVIVFFYLPDSPGTAKFLSESEQTQAVERLQTVDMTAKTRLEWNQVFNGLKDYKNYVHMLVHFCCNYSFAGLSNFLPTIIQEMGYTSINSQGLSAPPYFVSFLLCVVAAIISDKWGRRGIVIAVSATVGMIGYLILAAVQDETKPGVRYFGIWLATCGVFPALSVNITWLLNNQGGDSKKGAGMAILAVFGQCSSFISSSAFPDSEGPFYVRGCAIGCALTGAIAIMALGLFFNLNHENKRRDCQLEIAAIDHLVVALPLNMSTRALIKHVSHADDGKSSANRSKTNVSHAPVARNSSWIVGSMKRSRGQEGKKVLVITIIKPTLDQTNCRYKVGHSFLAREDSGLIHLASRDTIKENGMLAAGLNRIVSSGNDALGILFQAAAQEVDSTPRSHGTTRHHSSHAGYGDLDRLQYPPSTEVLRIWDACRFVKMGWFTAYEAFTLVDLFFKNMAPLSPILSEFYAKPHNHYWLVTQEPMLCCTVLMISSRYHTLPGVGGQEKLSKAKTRHLSSIEALLLISEWYPRALHFPPENDGWDSDLILSTPDLRDPPSAPEDVPMSDRWKEDVVEPTRRSDRMSWMLVSNALALAHELGVFGQGASKYKEDYVFMGSEADLYVQQLETRRQRLPLLLFVFVNLIAARIGCPSLLSDTPEDFLRPGGDREWASFMASWVELTRMTKEIIEQYFPSTKTDQRRRRWDIASVEEWRKRFDDILLIESQYLRIFINSIEMQSFVEDTLSLSDLTLQTSNAAVKDRIFLTEVIDGAGVILNHVIRLSNQHRIQYLPHRIFLRVISCSIFLLKALALGTRASTLHDSLMLLDKTIAALQSNFPDDIHLVSRYASLLQVYVSRVRQTFGLGNDMRNVNFQQETSQEERAGNEPAQEPGTWDHDIPLPESIFSDDWLSLPLDPLMAPFGPWDETGQLDYGLDSAYLDLDFIWNLPP